MGETKSHPNLILIRNAYNYAKFSIIIATFYTLFYVYIFESNMA